MTALALGASSTGLPPLGAPGVYWLPPTPIRALTGERMDVCAFVGVAPRGPARVPVWHDDGAGPYRVEPAWRSVAVPVESWSAYTRLFGRFEGPGLLPYAVASFFENGGRRAYIVRIVHAYALPDGSPDAAANEAGVAQAGVHDPTAPTGTPDLAMWLQARDEGAWGNRLTVALRFGTRPLALEPAAFGAAEVTFERGAELVAGATLRLHHASSAPTLAHVARVWDAWHPDRNVIECHAAFDAPITRPVVRAELVEGELLVDDGDGRAERHGALGLSPVHPRWLARVLIDESSLLYPVAGPPLVAGGAPRAWMDDGALALSASLPTYVTYPFAGGANRYADLVPDDFFDARWTPGDEVAGSGVHALTELADLSLVVAPDLYSPAALVPREPVVDLGGAGAEFCRCDPDTAVATAEAPIEALDGLRLDPRTDLARIVALQQRLIDLANALASFIVLLDVPPGLSQRRMLAWREQLRSMYAAAYHPWLRTARGDDGRDGAIALNPAAVAAGIIARREIERGVQYGPANEIALGVFDVASPVSPAAHAELHQRAINVYVPERDGTRLTGARTLSADPNYRQLSVRRLMTMLKRVLYRQMQWAVFEPNDARLRGDLRNQLDAYLRQLFAANAFAGARAEDAFFVRCDDELNPPAVVDAGRLVCLVGVAPAEPLEFLVLQIARDGDATLRVQG